VFQHAVAATFGTRLKALEERAPLDEDLLTFSESMSAPSLCSALAMADSSTYADDAGAFLGHEGERAHRLVDRLGPRIRSATSLPFWAERRTPRRIALVSMSRAPYFFAAGAGAAAAAAAGAAAGAAGPECLAGPASPPTAFLGALATAEWLLKMRVIAHSPSLLSHHVSVTYTGMCCLPLCTAIVSRRSPGRWSSASTRS